MPKHNMHVNLPFCTKAFLFACKNNRCGQRAHKRYSSSTNHSLPGMTCWVSTNHHRDLFRAIKTKNAAPPPSGKFLGFGYLPIFRSQVGHFISSVHLKFFTLSATNSQLLMKVQLSERQFLDRNHAEKV